jgi:hypothetical protein
MNYKLLMAAQNSMRTNKNKQARNFSHIVFNFTTIRCIFVKKNFKMRINKYHIIILLIASLFMACNKDKMPDLYRPVTLPEIQRIDFISKKDTSVFIYNDRMLLQSGRCNSSGFGAEWLTLRYSENNQLTGAEYEILLGQRYNAQTATYSRNERNLLSKVIRDDWEDQTFSFSYDEKHRLTLITINLPQNGTNRYTISYDELSNVSSVERYAKIAETEGETKWTFSDYDLQPNPFGFLVNVFYAPAFSSAYGPVRYDNIPFGLLLSKNNPGKMMEYQKNGNDYALQSTNSFRYEYGEDDYPISITKDDYPLLTIDYYK